MRLDVDFEENSSSFSVGEAGRARWFNLRRQDNIDCVKSSTYHLEACVQYKELLRAFLAMVASIRCLELILMPGLGVLLLGGLGVDTLQ